MTHALRTSLYALALVAAVGASAAAQAGPRKQVVTPGGQNSPLSNVVRSGGTLYISGQLPSRPAQGAPLDSTIQGQTRSVMENIKKQVEGAGATMDDIVKCTVFLLDTKDFQGMNSVYREFFPKDPPARSTVAVAGLVSPGAKLEIECIAAAK